MKSMTAFPKYGPVTTYAAIYFTTLDEIALFIIFATFGSIVIDDLGLLKGQVFFLKVKNRTLLPRAC